MAVILSPDDIAKLGGFLPKLIGAVDASRLLPKPKGAIADFIAAHEGEIAVFEKVSDFFFPGAGGIEAFFVFALRYSHPMDATEAARWMDAQNTEASSARRVNASDVDPTAGENPGFNWGKDS